MTHLKQHVFNSATDVCINCGAGLEGGHLPCDQALESATDYFDRDDPRWQSEESKSARKAGREMKSKCQHSLNEAQTLYVDIPTEDCVSNESGARHNIGEFDTEAAALGFAKAQFVADYRGRVFLVPSQMDERWDKLELAATDMVAVLKAELAALRIWQSARDPRSGPALPDDVWDGMTISIDKIEGVLRKAGIDDPVNARNLGQRRNEE